MSQHEQFGQACGMPMPATDAHSTSDKYCAYCSDSNGNLKPWEEAVSGLIHTPHIKLDPGGVQLSSIN